MSKGGSTSSTTQLPSWLEDAAKSNLSRANYASQLGYMPYYGNDVAAFSPMQTQGMSQTGQMAQAFGMAPQGFDPLAGIPTPTVDPQGFSGYSSGNMFDNAMSELQQRRRGQAAAYNSMFIDPYLGAAPNVQFTPFGSVASGVAPSAAKEASNYTMGTQGDVTNSAGNSFNISADGYLVPVGDQFAAGGYNIANDGSDGGMSYVGNTFGYQSNPFVSIGYGLKNVNPLISPTAWLLGQAVGDQMIGYDTTNIDGVGDTITTRGSFDQGEFSDSTPTDITGGAMGSNVAVNANGDAISVGYGYGQVDPAIAAAAGYTIDSSYNPVDNYTTVDTSFDSGKAKSLLDAGVDAGIANTVARDTAGTTKVVQKPETGFASIKTYYDDSGNKTGSYTSGGGGLTLSSKNSDGSYTVPSQVNSNSGGFSAISSSLNNNSSSSSDSGSSSSSGTYCCTAMRKNGDWTSPKRLYRMHKWHYDQPQWWRDGYDVWGKILANNLLTERGSVWSKIMNAFYEHRVAKKPATLKSMIADAMVYPAVFTIGMVKKITGKHVELVEVGE